MSAVKVPATAQARESLSGRPRPTLKEQAYERIEEAIGIIDRNGRVRELSEMADAAAVAEMTQSVDKPYVCYPKAVELELTLERAQER